MNTKMTIPEGITLSGLPFWLGIILVGLSFYYLGKASFLVPQILLCLAMVLGIILFLSIKGVVIDFENKMARWYLHFLIVKLFYKKTRLSDYKAVELQLFSQSQRMNMKSITTNVRTRVYELYLIANGKPPILIADSTDLAKAESIMESIAKGLDIESRNKYRQLRQRARSRRSKSRRRK